MFTFWEAVKILSLAFLALFAAKAVASLFPHGGSRVSSRQRILKPLLYSVILGLVILGTWHAAHDIAAEIYFWGSGTGSDSSNVTQAYSNAVQAAELRPGELRYWRAVLDAKMRLTQFQSALDDEPAVRASNGGELDEDDAYRFVLCNYLLDRYDRVIAESKRLIRQNPAYAAPYVLQGRAYIGERKYPEAEQSFQAVLQIFPDNQAAVEGLAHAYFLAGERGRALAVLNETSRFHFSPDARKRFEALKGLYGQ
jgi:tetratricopeptide (TPR) repeat protein